MAFLEKHFGETVANYVYWAIFIIFIACCALLAVSWHEASQCKPAGDNPPNLEAQCAKWNKWLIISGICAGIPLMIAFFMITSKSQIIFL